MNTSYTTPQNLTSFLNNAGTEEKLDIDPYLAEKLFSTFEVPELKEVHLQDLGIIHMPLSDPLNKALIVDFEAAGIFAYTYKNICTEKTRWTWKDFLPSKTVTILAGDPERGKSTIALDIISKISKGTLEGDLYGKPSNVLYLSSEDTDDIIGKRLIASGADLDRVMAFQIPDIYGNRYPSFPNDLDKLKLFIETREIKAVVLDPLMGFTSEHIDTYKERSVRSMLTPLGTIAEDHDCLFICLMHNKKSKDGNSISNISDSAAYTRYARSILTVATDMTSDNGNYILSVSKGSYAKEKRSLSYAITERIIELSDGEKEGQPVITWLGDSSISVENSDSSAQEGGRGEIISWMRDSLGDTEGYAPAKDLKERCNQELGHSLATISRCMEAAGICSVPIGNPRTYYLVLLNSGENKVQATKRFREFMENKPKTLLETALS